MAQPEIRRELLGAILLEMMYRSAPDLSAGTTYVPPPDWLLDGLRARTPTPWPAVLAAPAAAQEILSLEEFLRQRPGLLDASGRSLYGAYSFALVEFLTQMPNGRERLARFISDLPSASNDAMADLRMHFPELIDATRRLEEHLDFTHRSDCSPAILPIIKLAGNRADAAGLLSVRIANAGSENKYQLHEFPAFVREPAARPALTRLGRDLSALVGQANPIYRPVIYEYEKITARLARGKTRGIAERLAGLIAARERIAAQMREIDDYLNWFEATQPRGPSGAFGDYMKAADSAVRPEQRRDPISVYVDVLEMQFQN